MRFKPLSSLLRHALVGTVLAALVSPALWAHMRPYPHRHRKVHQHQGATIFLGAPKTVKHHVVLQGRPAGYLDMNIKPKTTEVWVDGRFRGIVDDFDGRPQMLRLRAGKHKVKLVTPDGTVLQRDIKITAGTQVEVKLNLKE